MLAALVTLMASTATVTPTPEVLVVGNIVLADEVYRAILYMDAVSATTSSITDPLTAMLQTPDKAKVRIKARIQDFLFASGYELARVEVSASTDRVVIDVDEGQLDKIIFLRQGTLANVELRFALHLPGRIYNRPLLERKLNELLDTTNIETAYYEVVEVEDVQHTGLQIEDPEFIKGLELLKPGSAYELRVRLDRSRPGSGLSPGLGFRGSDGLLVGFDYKLGDILTEGDFFNSRARVGFFLGNEIESDNNPVGISRVQLAGKWFAPAFGTGQIRGFLSVDANIFARPRDDLQIANYYFLPIAASVNLEVSLIDVVKLTIGIGGEDRRLFGVDDRGENDQLLARTEDNELRFFLQLGAEVVFDPNELRLDRQHRLNFSGRFLAKGTTLRATPITELWLEYQAMRLFGFDELRFRSTMAHRWGEVPFYNELSINDGFLRSGFGTELFIRRAAATQVEYRLSLSRDDLKLAVFDDFVLYQKLDALRDSVGFRVASTFGIGLNYLLLDSFQINVYTGVALDQDLGLGLGINVQVARAF